MTLSGEKRIARLEDKIKNAYWWGLVKEGVVSYSEIKNLTEEDIYILLRLQNG